MNFADIENMWRAPGNRPSPAELETQKMKLVADLKRRHRGFVFFIGTVTAVLTVITVSAIAFIVSEGPEGKFELAREWGVLPVLALPWAAAILFIRNYRRHRAEHGHYDRSIADSVRALLDENRISAMRLKIAAGLHAAFLVVLPLMVHQLRAAGKAGDEILVPAYVLWPMIAGGIGAAMWIYYRKKLLPERARLEGLLASYR